MLISLSWTGLGLLGLLAAWVLLTAPRRRHRHWLFFWVDEMAVALSGQRLSRQHRRTRAEDPVEGHLPASLVDARTFSSVDLGGLRLKNRIIRAAAFGGAGMDDLIACHEEVARGGAAMTTVACEGDRPANRPSRAFAVAIHRSPCPPTSLTLTFRVASMTAPWCVCPTALLAFA